MPYMLEHPTHITSVGCSKYNNIEIVPDQLFINHFFENNKRRKPPYTFINIDTKRI